MRDWMRMERLLQGELGGVVGGDRRGGVAAGAVLASTRAFARFIAGTTSACHAAFVIVGFAATMIGFRRSGRPAVRVVSSFTGRRRRQGRGLQPASRGVTRRRSASARARRVVEVAADVGVNGAAQRGRGARL